MKDDFEKWPFYGFALPYFRPELKHLMVYWFFCTASMNKPKQRICFSLFCFFYFIPNVLSSAHNCQAKQQFKKVQCDSFALCPFKTPLINTSERMWNDIGSIRQPIFFCSLPLPWLSGFIYCKELNKYSIQPLRTESKHFRSTLLLNAKIFQHLALALRINQTSGN